MITDTSIAISSNLLVVVICYLIYVFVICQKYIFFCFVLFDIFIK
jgi:hypothetical protein